MLFMAARIITISRQFGSGGHTIGEMVAKKLDIPFYDNELVTKIAEKKMCIRDRGKVDAQ